MHKPIKIPPLLQTSIQMSLSSIDGMLFKDRGPCPHCGGRPVGYDTKDKIFADLLTPNGTRQIVVFVRRFRCRDCGRLLYADEPFYPGTRTGSVIIDLANSLSTQHSYSHTAEIMHALGIGIDRGSVRNFALSALPLHKMNIMYGMQMPNTFVTLMSKLLIPGMARPLDIVEFCGYPSRYKAPEDLHGTAAGYRKMLAGQKAKNNRNTDDE